MERLEPSPSITVESSAIAFELNNSKATVGKVESLSRWSIGSLYMYIICLYSSVANLSPEKYNVTTGHINDKKYIVIQYSI